jgi:hypothetical protein
MRVSAFVHTIFRPNLRLRKSQHKKLDSIADRNKDFSPSDLMGCNLPFSFQMGVGGNLFPRVQSLGHKAGHSHPSSVEVMNAWISTSKPISLLGLVFIPAQRLF